MIYLARVTLTDSKASFIREVVTTLPPSEAKACKEVLHRATRGMTETRAKSLSISKVEHIKEIKGLH